MSQLLDLPLEIRTIILRFVVDTAYANIRADTSERTSDFHVDYALKAEKGVLLTCHQLHTEVQAIMPQAAIEVTFLEDDATAIARSLLDTKNPFIKLDNITKITAKKDVKPDPDIQAMARMRKIIPRSIYCRRLLSTNPALVKLFLASSAQEFEHKSVTPVKFSVRR